jgi:hypothetical protein
VNKPRPFTRGRGLIPGAVCVCVGGGGVDERCVRQCEQVWHNDLDAGDVGVLQKAQQLMCAMFGSFAPFLNSMLHSVGVASAHEGKPHAFTSVDWARIHTF